MGLAATTTNLSYARNEYIKTGVSFVFDKCADMIYYVMTNNDIAMTLTNTLTVGVDGTGLDVKFFGDTAGSYLEWDADDDRLELTNASAQISSRTSGSGADLGTHEEGLLVAAQYTDSATLINTTDYVGCAGIFDLKLGRAITLASGGGYGFASLWANLEVDKAINATGAQSAAWMTVWADASGADAAITGTSRLQVLDLAFVTGSAFDAGASTKIYGLRIDSSVHTSATMDGEFAAIDIGKSSSGKKDWTRGIDIADCTTGIYCANPIQIYGDANLIVGSRTAGSAADLGTVEEGLVVATQYTDAAALANTSDYVGCSGIFDLKLGRAITLASGGGYGFASLWANLELDEDINSTGGQSAAWFTVWADATKDFEGSSRIQVVDIAVVAGAGEDFGASTKLYGLRIDSSVNDSATVDGEFAAIDIGKSGSNKNWTRGIDIANATTGIYIASTATTAISCSTPITSTCAATAAVGVTATQTSATPGTVRGIYLKETTHSSMTSGNVVGVRGEVTVGGTVSTGVYLYGTQGKLIGGSNTITAGNGMVCGIYGQLDVSGTTIASGWVSAIHADIYGANSGSIDINLISATHAGGGVINALLSLFGKSDYVFDISSNTHDNVGTTGTVTTDDGYIKVLIDGSARYIGLGSTVA